MKINKKQIESVLKLDGQKRYEHSIKMIADREEVYGLYNNGWGLVSDGKQTLFPIWSAKEYAQINAIEDFENFKPKAISLKDFIEDVLPTLKDNNDGVTVFLTPENNGVTPDIDRLISDIKVELQNYE